MTFEQIWAVVRRAAPLALIGMLGLGAIALVYSLLTPRLYEATARVVVEPQAQKLTSDDVVAVPGRDVEVVDTEVEFLESSSVAARVVRNRKLVTDPEFGTGAVNGTAAKFADALHIRRVGMTYLIDISVESQSPRRAAELANATAEAYVELQKERKRSTLQSASDLLRQRVDRLVNEVQAAEAAVQRYRIDNNLMSVNGTTLAEQSAAELSEQLASARAQERAAQGELAAAAGARVGTDTAQAQQSVGTLRAQQATAQQAMSEAESRYGNRHPTYLAAQERLSEINRAVEAETARARSAVGAEQRQRLADLRAKASAASNLRASLEASAGANEAGLTRNSRASTELADLERTAQAKRQTYQADLGRLQQVQTQLGTEQSDSNIVAAAMVPGAPSKPNVKLNLAFGLVAGLLAGIAVAAIVMMFESHFTSKRQVEQALDLEGLPSLPTARSADLDVRRGTGSVAIAREMLDNPTESFAEMHKNLVNALDRPVDGRPNQVIAVTSTLPREGKTTAAICLAAIAAHTGKRTLLVDCDQRRRGATRQFLDDVGKGLSDALAEPQRSRDMILRSPFEGLDLLPATKLPGSEVDVFDRERFGALIEVLRSHYDLVLLDTAPVLPIADTRILVEHVDSVLFLCRWRSTSRKAVETALDILGRTGALIAGVALTQVDLKQQSRFGYGDDIFYYRKYKSYYQENV